MSTDSYSNHFFKDTRLPYLKVRHTINSATHYRPHRHSGLSIGAIEKGAASFSASGQTNSLYPGTLVLINPEIVHACNPAENTARSFFMLYLDNAWSVELQSSIFGETKAFIPMSPTFTKEEHFYTDFTALCRVIFDDERLLLEKEEKLEQFMLRIFSNYCDAQAQDFLSRRSDKKSVEDMRQYLQTHVATNPAVSQIAKAVNLSSSHVTRIFKSVTGITPHAYLLNLKIEHAKELLHSDMPIAEIALEIGLSDQSHLNRLFKQYAACTPNEYRRGLI